MIYKIILLFLITLNLGFRIAKHGKIEEKRENGNFAIFSFTIIMWLLYMSGFFNEF